MPIRQPRPLCLGFTLIEMLIVITIIGILAGLAFPASIAVMNAMKKSRTKTTIDQISASLEQWRSTIGSFPDAIAPNQVSALPSGWDTTTDTFKPCDNYTSQTDLEKHAEIQGRVLWYLLKAQNPEAWSKEPKDQYKQTFLYVPARYYPSQPERMPMPDAYHLWSRGANLHNDEFEYDGQTNKEIPWGGNDDIVNFSK